MKANEIRKGIYLKWKDNQQEFDVTLGLMSNKFFWNHIENKDIIPIILTEKWLSDFGFDEWASENWKKKDDKSDWPPKWNYYLPYKNLSLYCGNANIKYVHQLQNLYFSLTGKELIKNSLEKTNNPGNTEK